MSRTFKTPILLPADPTAALEAATKQYVDGKVPDVFQQTTQPAAGGLTSGDVWIDTDDVSPGIPIFDNVAQRDSNWTSPPNGAKCVTTDTNTEWLRQAGIWRPVGGVTPGAYLYRNSAYSLPSGAWTAIPFNATGYNNLCTIQTTTITVLHAGIYMIVGQVWFQAGVGGSWRVAKLVQNGTWALAQQQLPPSTQGPFPIPSAIVPLAANDTVALHAYQDIGSAMPLLVAGATEIGTSLYVQQISGRN